VNKKEILKTIDTTKPSGLVKRLRSIGVVDQIRNEVSAPDDMKDSEAVYIYYHSINPLCKCGSGKRRQFIGFTKGYRVGCHRDCPEVIKVGREKAKQTMIEKYGDDYGQELRKMSLQSFLDKNNIDDTNITNISQTRHWKEKRNKKDKEFYDGVVKKVKKTNQERYGVDCVLQLDEVKNKIKQTNRKRYGVDNAAKSQQSIDKLRNTKLGLRYVSIENLPNGIEPLFNQTDYSGITVRVSDNFFHWYCGDCGTGFGQALTHSKTIPTCPSCTRLIYGTSKDEKEIGDYVESLLKNITVKKHHRGLIGDTNQEVDIYIPSLNIAIEYNGLYWHTEDKTGSKKYHMNKYLECQKHGVQLITIFSHQWKNKKEVVKNLLKHKLGCSDKVVYARQCVIEDVSNKEVREFYDSYHLQGHVNSSLNYALRHAGEIIAVMSFRKPRHFMSNDKEELTWEITRFATKYQVTGGASKLLTHFKRNNEWNMVKSFSDNCYSDGGLYKTLDFEVANKPRVGYGYFKTNGNEELHYRYKFNKQRLIEEGHDPDKSESQIMAELGYQKVWDCGQTLWVLKNKDGS